MDKICVLMSTYNGDKYIEEQLNSILTQRGDYELKVIIRDDGSTDETIAILQEYQKKYCNISLIQGSNIGWMKSFNELLFYAEDADYYAFSDQDDVWMENKLQKAIDKIEKENNENNIILYGSNVIETDENLKPLKETCSNIARKKDGLSVMLNSFVLGCTMVFTREARNLYISKPKQMKQVGHDWLMATLCTFFGKTIFDDNAYMYHRRHGDNASGSLKLGNAVKTRMILFKSGKIGYTVYRELYDGYRELLPSKDKKIVEDFIHYKTSVLSKIRLLLNPRVKKYTLKGTVILKLAILCNRYV